MPHILIGCAAFVVFEVVEMLSRNDYRVISERIIILKKDLIKKTIQNDRATSLVITKLDEAEMWLNKVGIE